MASERFTAEPFTPEQRKLLWRMICRYPPGATYGEGDLARYELTVKALEEELADLHKKLEDIRGVLRDLSCDGCEYGDNCPDDANHYVCRSCQMIRALEKYGNVE